MSRIKSPCAGEVKKLGFAAWRNVEHKSWGMCVSFSTIYKNFMTIQGHSCDEMLALFFGICKVLFETMYFKRDVHHLWWWELSKCPATSCYKSCGDQNPNQSLNCKHATFFLVGVGTVDWLVGAKWLEKNLLYCKYIARSWKRKKRGRGWAEESNSLVITEAHETIQILV